MFRLACCTSSIQSLPAWVVRDPDAAVPRKRCELFVQPEIGPSLFIWLSPRAVSLRQRDHCPPAMPAAVPAIVRQRLDSRFQQRSAKGMDIAVGEECGSAP